ncbi:hypothetical protein D6219_11375 [Coxiella burnetii]|nr:hypothetical protein D6219_05375 [Coxiella burnetii]AZV76276.1 hypothetical protein D6219_11375 [Coxiella burnetii]OYK86633.1 hypothetical protein CbuQ229_02885 [Coxiella burnetii]PHH56336.1 hypothetical protein CRH12_11500 [Coxiella burnetii]PNT82058.1 hypothetical protein C2L93_11395 [Coxiella burnetii]
MDLLLFLKIEILCWRIMTPSLRGGSISLGYLATWPPRRLRKPTLSIAPPLITHGRLFFPISLISKKPRPPRLRAWVDRLPGNDGS